MSDSQPRQPLTYVKATPLLLASRYLGEREVAGSGSNPLILAWLRRVAPWANGDEVPWCSAFVYNFAWELDLPRPSRKPAMARSWMVVGLPVNLVDASPGFDVVVLRRGRGEQPGAEVLDAPGHVAFYLSHDDTRVSVRGGNQGDSVCDASYPISDLLCVRRLSL